MAKNVINASITPYYPELSKHGIHLYDRNNQITLHKLKWPRKRGHRKPIGGMDDAILHEPISLHWVKDELWTTTFNECSLEAKHLSKDEIDFSGHFYAQLDGDIAYIPEDNQHDFLIIFCEDIKRIDKQPIFHAIKFSKDCSVRIESFLIHSLPIPIKLGEKCTFNVYAYHRAVNAKTCFVSPYTIHLHILQVERAPFILLKDSPREDDFKEPTLPWTFTSRILTLEPVNLFNFAGYGLLISHLQDHREQIQPAHWPYLMKANKNSRVGSLEQEFKISWLDVDATKFKHKMFNGLSGSYEGKVEKLGIEFNSDTNEYSVDILTTRPDGTYFLYAKDNSTKFAMIFALADKLNGDPVEDTLKVFLFQNGQALRLDAGVWHSLPILIYPHGEAEFCEIVCETNALIEINLHYECGEGLKFRSD